MISKNKKACNIYLQKMKFLELSSFCAQLQVSNEV